MSYHTWSIDGYGICVDDIKTTKKGVLDLLALAPQVKEDFFENYEIDENTNEIDFMASVDDYETDTCYKGLGALLQDILLENETINFTLCDDFDCVQYIIYVPRYPWCMNEAEKSLKAEDIDNIFKKYIRILTDQTIKCEIYSVENGG